MKNQIALKPQETPRSLELKNSPTAKTQLAEAIAQCFNSLNVYGKDPSQLSDTVKLFLFVLEDYPADSIIPAFKVFLNRNSRMPTPADIAAIIRRNGRPPLDQAVYVSLCQKKERTKFTEGGRTYDCLTTEEDDYVKEYEKDALGIK